MYCTVDAWMFEVNMSSSHWARSWEFAMYFAFSFLSFLDSRLSGQSNFSCAKLICLYCSSISFASSNWHYAFNFAFVFFTWSKSVLIGTLTKAYNNFACLLALDCFLFLKSLRLHFFDDFSTLLKIFVSWSANFTSLRRRLQILAGSPLG